VNLVNLPGNYVTFSTQLIIIFVWNYSISMETQTTIAKPFLKRIRRSVTASQVAFDLPSLIDRMKHAPSWTTEALHAEILLKSPSRQIVLAALREGTEIESFQANHSITVHVIEGKVEIHTRNGFITLGKGEVLPIKEKSKYSLTTVEDAVVLLTIVKDKL